MTSRSLDPIAAARTANEEEEPSPARPAGSRGAGASAAINPIESSARRPSSADPTRARHGFRGQSHGLPRWQATLRRRTALEIVCYDGQGHNRKISYRVRRTAGSAAQDRGGHPPWQAVGKRLAWMQVERCRARLLIQKNRRNDSSTLDDLDRILLFEGGLIKALKERGGARWGIGGICEEVAVVRQSSLIQKDTLIPPRKVSHHAPRERE
jgi:hypothetical protein